MSRADFILRTYDAIQQIPEGKVTSYGHIARLIGYPTYARHVGYALRDCPDDVDIPWQRVVSAKGVISPRENSGSVHTQAAMLRDEGVTVVDEPVMSAEFVGGSGGRVNLAVVGWFPNTLPRPYICQNPRWEDVESW